MVNNEYMFIFCVLWILRYAASFPDCCRVTRIQGASHVTCSGCQLQVVPQDLPINTTVLNLLNNNLHNLHEESFPNLPLLQTLDLRSNRLVSISSGTFDNVWSIEHLDLSDNYLDHLSIDLTSFESLKNLKTLNIQRNNFHLKKVYPEYVLSSVSQLESLFLDIFEGFFFGNGFLNLTQLRNLDILFIGTERVSFLNTSFHGLKRSNITELSIIANIRKMEKDFLSPFRVLTTLKLHSFGFVMNVRDALQGLYGLRARVMESLVIRSFREKHTTGVNLVKADLLYLGSICVKKLDLSDNRIECISQEALIAWTSRTCIEVLDVSANQIPSPHLLFHLMLFTSITHLYNSYSYTPYNVKKTRSILEASTQTFFLPKHLVYINISHGSISGPLINATIAKGNHLQVLDLSYSNGRPSCSNGVIKGLVHLTELHISGVDCSVPNLNMLADMPNLSRLGASRCNLRKVLTTNTTSLFKGLYNLSFVDISSNSLDSLNMHVFADQGESLKTIILAGNHMDRIPLRVLKHFTVIETIDLSNNLISTLSYSEYSRLDEVKFKIVLVGNPLVCSCDNLDFISWIGTTEAIYNKDELTCVTPGGSQLNIVHFLESFDQFQASCVSQFWLIISVILTVIFFMVGILALEAWRRSVLLRMRCRQTVEHTRYPNDIFISYCDEDSGWVANTFIPWLDEKEIEYCFDEKSFMPGRDIADNIMDAIDNSNQTVFVVSCAFLEREWTTFTLKLATGYSFRDGRENMNIIILLNDMHNSEFPKLVRKNWDVIRPLRWPNESNTNQEKLITDKHLFWKRLLKRIQRGNDHFLSASVSESTLLN